MGRTPWVNRDEPRRGRTFRIQSQRPYTFITPQDGPSIPTPNVLPESGSSGTGWAEPGIRSVEACVWQAPCSHGQTLLCEWIVPKWAVLRLTFWESTPRPDPVDPHLVSLPRPDRSRLDPPVVRHTHAPGYHVAVTVRGRDPLDAHGDSFDHGLARSSKL